VSGTTIFVALALIAFLCADLARTLRTGRARGKGGTITKHGQHKRYWRYAYSNCGLLVVVGIMLIWVVICGRGPALIGTLSRLRGATWIIFILSIWLVEQQLIAVKQVEPSI
jgi:hypothetical protein